MISCILAIVSFRLNAQNYVDIMNLRYNYIPVNCLKEDENSDLTFTNYNIDFALPLEQKNKDVFITGAGFDKFKASTTETDQGSLNLTSVKLFLGYLHAWKNSRWTSYLEFTPKLNSDLKKIGSNHFQFGGIFLNYYQKSDNFNFQLGLFYNGETYGPFIVPLLGFEWNSGDRTFLSLLLPALMFYEYKLSKRIYLGAEIELTGETYRLGNSIYANSFISNFGENKLTFLVKTRLFADFYIAKNLVLYAKPGFRLFQKYQQFTVDDKLMESPDRISGNLKNSFYIETGMAFRIRFDE